MIHNVCNPSPDSYSNRQEGTLDALRKCLQDSTSGSEHIIVGDLISIILPEIASNHSPALTTSRGKVTWQARGSQSTVDLAFLSQPLVIRLIKYESRCDLAQLSDHIPFELTFDLQPQRFVHEAKSVLGENKY